MRTGISPKLPANAPWSPTRMKVKGRRSLSQKSATDSSTPKPEPRTESEPPLTGVADIDSVARATDIDADSTRPLAVPRACNGTNLSTYLGTRLWYQAGC